MPIGAVSRVENRLVALSDDGEVVAVKMDRVRHLNARVILIAILSNSFVIFMTGGRGVEQSDLQN